MRILGMITFVLGCWFLAGAVLTFLFCPTEFSLNVLVAPIHGDPVSFEKYHLSVQAPTPNGAAVNVKVGILTAK